MSNKKWRKQRAGIYLERMQEIAGMIDANSLDQLADIYRALLDYLDDFLEMDVTVIASQIRLPGNSEIFHAIHQVAFNYAPKAEKVTMMHRILYIELKGFLYKVLLRATLDDSNISAEEWVAEMLEHDVEYLITRCIGVMMTLEEIPKGELEWPEELVEILEKYYWAENRKSMLRRAAQVVDLSYKTDDTFFTELGIDRDDQNLLQFAKKEELGDAEKERDFFKRLKFDGELGELSEGAFNQFTGKGTADVQGIQRLLTDMSLMEDTLLAQEHEYLQLMFRQYRECYVSTEELEEHLAFCDESHVSVELWKGVFYGIKYSTRLKRERKLELYRLHFAPEGESKGDESSMGGAIGSRMGKFTQFIKLYGDLMKDGKDDMQTGNQIASFGIKLMSLFFNRATSEMFSLMDIIPEQ